MTDATLRSIIGGVSKELHMRAKIIASIIWAFVIYCGVKCGIEMPDIDIVRNQLVPASDSTKLLCTLAPFLFGLLIPFFMRKCKNDQLIVCKFIDRILGIGISEEITHLIHFNILAPLFFIVIGFIGLIKVGIIGLTGFRLLILFIPLCFGIGLSISFMVIGVFFSRGESA
jgi:hypothetical protein